MNLTGPTYTRGSWDGIHVAAGGAVHLQQARLTYATTGIAADNALVSLSGSRIGNSQYDAIALTGACTLNTVTSSLRNNGRYGLWLLGAVTGTVKTTEFLNNGNYPVYALARNVGCLAGANTYTTNGHAAVGVSCAEEPDLTVNTTWNSQPVPYDLSANVGGGTLSVGAACTLTLMPGVRLLSSASGGVDVHGRLQAIANAQKPISFLPLGASPPGAWNGLTFFAGSSGYLKRCVVDYAQTGILATSASPRLEHTSIRHSLHDGVACAGKSLPIILQCTITDNHGDGVSARDTSAPNLGNLSNVVTTDDGANTLQNNLGYNLRVTSTANVSAQNNYWGTTTATASAAHIYDGHNQAGAGVVTFLPLLTSPPATTASFCGPLLAGAWAQQAAGGTVEIRVRLLSAASLSLRVYNLAGRPVATLPETAAGVGERVLLWSARSDQGQHLPPGAYLLEITARSPEGAAARSLVALDLG